MTQLHVAAYLRISKSDDRSTSLDKQRRNITRLVADRWPGATVTEFVDDGGSATKSRPRPAYTELSTRLAEFNVVVIDTQDRLDRRPLAFWTFAAEAERHSVPVVAASEDLDLSTADGEMTAGIRLTVARAEARRTGSRVRNTNALRASRGQRALGGPAPFGLRREGDVFRPDPEHASRVVKAVRRIIAGKLTERGWAAELTAAGIPTPRGGDVWPHRTVNKLLRNPALAGMTPHRGDVLRGDDGMPLVDAEAALLSSEDWEALQRTLATRAAPKQRLNKGLPLLHGLVVDEHGHRMYAHRMKNRKDRYTCRLAGCPSQTSIDMEALNEHVSGRILEWLGPLKETRAVVVQPERDMSRLAALRADLRACSAAQADAGTDEEFEALTARMRTLRASIKEEEQRDGAPRTRFVPTGRTVQEAYDAAPDDDARRTLVGWVYDAVVVRKGQRGGQHRDLSCRVTLVRQDEAEEEAEAVAWAEKYADMLGSRSARG